MKNPLIPDWLWKPNVFPRTLQMMLLVYVAEILTVLMNWIFNVSPLVPGPMEVLQAFPKLGQQHLMYHLGVSYWVYFRALCLATIISVVFAYTSRFTLGRPIAITVGAMRFLGTSGLWFFFVRWFGGGESLKIAVLSFSIIVFFTKDAVMIVENGVKRTEYDHAYSLGLSEWGVLWMVVIRGTMGKMFGALKQNAAMGVVMLGMVEAAVRPGGGIGTLLSDHDKAFDIATIIALNTVVLAIFSFQDFIISCLARLACPYERFETREE